MTAAALDPATADERIPPAVVAAENDVSEATAARWIRRGLRLPSGRRLKLSAERRFGRWLTTRTWVREFLAELQAAYVRSEITPGTPEPAEAGATA